MIVNVHSLQNHLVTYINEQNFTHIIGESTEHRMLVERRDQYKKAALAAKHSGDMATARNFVKISKVSVLLFNTEVMF